MKNKNLMGTGVALITPMNKDKSIDFDTLKVIVENQINNGVDYLVVQGTTAESPTLSQQEKQKTLDFVRDVNAGRLGLVFGIGGNDTSGLIESYKSYNLEGVDAILSASPYYNKPSQEGIYQHYKALSENFDLPIILYNVPGRTARNIEIKTTIRLARDFKNIIAIKEASGDMMQVMGIINSKPEDFLVISGDDALTLPMISCGASGLISVIANAMPYETSQMVSNAMNGNYDLSREFHYKLLDFVNLIFEDGNPSGVKYLLELMNIGKANLRLPLININENVETKINEKYNTYFAIAKG